MVPGSKRVFPGPKEGSLCAACAVLPRLYQGFCHSDTSNVGLGALLSQVHSGEEQPAVYLSRKCIELENEYTVILKECLTIKWALDALRYYLLGYKFDLIIDHVPLKWMAQNKEIHRRVNWWFLTLWDYSLTVKHRPGTKMGKCKCLSQVYSCWATGTPTLWSK